ncbi:MAG: Flagellar hook-associated protein 1 [Candidatus Accumulibacter appositus]|uniref:Flagellar hook-associated protein 1 n=1 Tax=Candidatus Accumulibacter appositus TaxID=1454003 RepID=A0A011QRG1_9PROT|nr:flagellar hook-associated protein FlgK [Accumulibacter sp.]EXI81444.1 MAG: Flagellar hook-associated protein 1 [Candidatus Accumulibacter appositus]HRF03295.1 flagellar hook-associated protein FlgK [Accumulibacter sp.]
MGSGIINTAVTGLNVAQYGLLTTEHNIANANTPGFSRQRSIQESNVGLLTGAGYVGQGAHVATVERMYSRFLSEQVDRSQSSASELETYYTQIRQIDNLLADPGTGLSPALQSFFGSVQDLAANPSQLPNRQAMVSAAQSLTARYQSLSDQLAEMYGGINSEITAAVASINSYGEQIASLNGRISVAEASTGQPPNDLLDARDQMVLELNQLIRTRTTTNTDGSYNVFVGSGQQLVVGAQLIGMATMPSSADSSRLVVGLRTAAGVQEMPQSLISGGSLSGLLAFRSESLDRASNDLGSHAASLALTFNAQHTLGQDFYGQSQLASTPPTSFTPQFFSVSPPVVVGNTRNPPGSPLVSAAFVTPPPFDGNYYTDLGNSDYRLNADGAGLTLTRLTDNKQWAGADLAAVNAQLSSDPQGFVLAAPGALLAGSSYLIQPTRGAARSIAVNPALVADSRLIAAAGPLRAAAGTANTGSASVSLGQAGPGYPDAVAGLPISLEYQAGELRNFPVGARVSIDGAAPVDITASDQGIAYTSGATLTLVGSANVNPPAGFSFVITGLPNNGDRFSVELNTGATADGRNALSLAQLQTQQTMSGQTASYQDAYARLVSETGNKTRQLQVSSEAQENLLAQARASRDSLSAVNLDEEAANLIRYQQAYQASARAFQIGASLFDTILELAA